MSEKKDCVERGKRALNQLAIDLQFADNEVKTKAQIVAVCKAGIEALTALEGRVNEVESENRSLKTMRSEEAPE